MELGKSFRKENLKKLYKKYGGILIDFIIFFSITVVFHFLYWNTNMDSWLFGPYSKDVFAFFTDIAYKGTVLLSKVFNPYDFDYYDNTLFFYKLNELGQNYNFAFLKVVESCSGVKQLFQLLVIMLFMRNSIWKRLIYFLLSIPIILFFNIVRITSIGWVLVEYPHFADFFHLHIARYFHYVIIFIIWAVWIKYFSKKRSLPQASRPKVD